jgi:hypothetical protein
VAGVEEEMKERESYFDRESSRAKDVGEFNTEEEEEGERTSPFMDCVGTKRNLTISKVQQEEGSNDKPASSLTEEVPNPSAPPDPPHS